MLASRRLLIALLAALPIWVASPARAAVEIEYWQYTFKQRVEAMDALIGQFQAANPGITVKQVTVPYDNYRTRIAAAIPAGEGPDVAQLFYGWLGDYTRAGLLQPLPKAQFDPDAIDRDFFPFVRGMKSGGQYYALPTTVRALALFWNKKLFREAGLDPEKPPATLDAFVEAARKITKQDAGGNMLTEGVALDMSGQDHHWLREGLIREFGGAPYSEDGRTVAYATPAAAAAVRWYADLVTKEKVGAFGFMTDAVTAFRAGRAGMTIDGSFRLAALDGQRGLDYGVAELPAQGGRRYNFASYWANGITAKAKGEKLEAAAKFLAFITTPDAMKLWLEKVGELPARVSLARGDAIRNDPKYGPFVRGLDAATATDFVDESAQRQVFLDMMDRVVLKNVAPLDSLTEAAAQEQKILGQRP